ncbi:MAG: hypothetical protein HYY05_08500 [Chloroflexi bacterium]|nr:hypothetical protein [Chloroflexota bacterium]
MQSRSFERFAGAVSLAAGAAAFLYAVAFIVIRANPQLTALFLLLMGLLATAPLVAIYRRLMERDGAMALWALLLGVVSATGTAIHGGYDLANAINPPAAVFLDLPSQIDPRGLLTFGFMSISLFTIGWLISQGGRLPRSLGYLGILSATLLLLLYLGRLTFLDATSPIILVPAVLEGFIVAPAWWIGLGLALLRRKSVSFDRGISP